MNRGHFLRWVCVGVPIALMFAWALRTHDFQQWRKTEIVNALQDIGMGIHGQRIDKRAKWLPEGPRHGEQTDSWRFGLIGYFERRRDDAYEVPWRDGPYARFKHRTFCLTGHQNKDGFFTTNCLAVVGPGTLADSPCSTFEEDAILVVAVGDTDIAWGEAGDLRVDEFGRLIDHWPGPIDGSWIGVCFGDGRAWLLRASVPLTDLERFFTVDGAREYNADEILGPYLIMGRSFCDKG
jgi:hypothetical protein